MKRILFLLIGVFVSMAIYAETKEVKVDSLTFSCNTDTKQATLTKSTSITPTVTIPATITDPKDSQVYNVVAIGTGSNIFDNDYKGYIKNLVIEEGVTTIKASAFSNCNNLRKIELPVSITTIGSNAFSSSVVHVWCKKLDPIGIADNTFSNYAATLYVQPTKYDAYHGANGWKKFQTILEGDMKEAVVGNNTNNMTYICATSDKKATLFSINASPTSVTIPATISATIDGVEGVYEVIAIDKSLIVNEKSKIEDLKIESDGANGVKIIGANAFDSWSNMRKVELPATLTKLGGNAFINCSRLAHVCCKVLDPSNTLSIGSTPFPNNTSTSRTLYVPETSFGNYDNETWKTTYSFQKILQGDMLERTNDGMSYICASVSKEASLYKGKDSNVTIPASFTDANSVTYYVTEIGREAFKGKNLTDLIIPNGITAIGSYAFQDCKNLTKIELPQTLDTIMAAAFAGCNKIAQIHCKAVNKVGLQNITQNYSTTYTFSSNIYNSAILYVPSGSYSTYKNDDDRWGKFNDIREGELKEKYFDDTRLTYVCLKDADPSKNTATLTKAESTISGDLVIPETITDPDDGAVYTVVTIGKSAFQGCTGLSKIDMPATITQIGENAFNGCSSLKYIVSRINATNLFGINNNVFSTSTSSKTFTAILFVPEGATNKYRSTNGWRNFKFVFEGEKKEKTVSNMTYVYGSASNTAILNLSESTIDDVIIPSTFKDNDKDYYVKAIEKYAFKGNSMTSLTIKEGIDTIGAYAFQSCSNLKKIEFPSTLYKIDDNAFNSCNNILNIVSKILLPSGFNYNVFSEKTYAQATLYVPTGYIDDYQHADGWKNFTSFLEGEMKKFTDNENGMTYSYATGSKTAILIETTSDAETIIIPNSIKVDDVTYKVITIDKAVFKNRTKLVNLTIGDSIQIIGESAFQGCSSLVKVVLPKNLTTIGTSVFDGCKSLAHVCSKLKVPLVIDNTVFPDITSTGTKTLYVPKGTTIAYKNQAGWGDKFSTILEGEMLEQKDDKGMTYICATDSKVAILVQGNMSATDVIVLDSVSLGGVKYHIATIDKAAFSGATNLVYLTIQNTETIRVNAFKGCTKLQKITFENDIKNLYISDDAFSGCSNLTHIVSHVKTPIAISETAFPSNNTATLYVPSGTTSLYKAVSGWGKLTIQEGDMKEKWSEDGLLYYICLKGDKTATATLTKANATKISSDGTVIIPDTVTVEGVKYGVTTIRESVFQNWTKLRTIELPATLTGIGNYAFDGCNSLAYIISRIQVPFTISGNVFSVSSAMLFVPEGTTDKYKKTDGWIKFSNNIYEGDMKPVTMDGTMSYVCATGSKTAILVKGATTLTNAIIPATIPCDTITCKVVGIDANAFLNCTKLQEIDLPSGLIKIGDNAFSGCEKIQKIVSRIMKPFGISDNVFSASITSSAKLYVPVGTTELYQKADGWKEFQNILLGETKTVVQNDMTYICVTGSKTATLTKSTTALKDVVVPSTIIVEKDTFMVLSIDKSAFSNLKDIQTLTIQEGIVAIGDNAFQNCLGIIKMELPSSVSQIGEKAFYGCSSIKDIICKIETPFAINNNVFSESIYNTATLYVPKNKTAKYLETDGWKEFKSFLEGEKKKFTDIEKGMTYTYATGSKTAILIETTSDEKDITIPATIIVDSVTYKVTTIDKSVFKERNSLVNLTIGDSVQVIGDNAFQYCGSLEKVVLPKNLSKIGAYAFGGCKSLAHLCSKAQTPATIDDTSFPTIEITGTKTLYVPKDATGAYKSAAGWGDKFSAIWEGEMLEQTDDNGMTYICATDSKIAILVKGNKSATDVTVLDSITWKGKKYHVVTIDKSAFSYSGSLVYLTIQGAETIGTNAFQGCSKLRNLILDGDIKNLYIGDKAFDNCNSLLHIVNHSRIPTNISETAFSSYSATLYVPTGSTELYQQALGWGHFTNILEGDMKELTESGLSYICLKGDKTATAMLINAASTISGDVTIPDTVTVDKVKYAMTTIVESAFQNCTKLRKIELPSTLMEIGDNAFDGCSSLAYIVSKIKDPFKISGNVFSVSSAMLFVPEGSTAKYKTTEGWTKFSNSTLEGDMKEETLDGMTYVCATVSKTATLVKGTTTLTNAIIPATIPCDTITCKVVAIGANAFQNCNKLQVVDLPSGITQIGDYAFDGCTGLIHINTRINKPFDISENVFSSATIASAKLYVPIGTTELYQKALGWNKFKNILQGEMKEVTQNDMTYTCVTGSKTATLIKATTTLSDVIVPSTIIVEKDTFLVTAIDKSAFSDRKTIKNLTIQEGIRTIGDNAFQNCTGIVNIELPASIIQIGEYAFDNCKSILYLVSKIKEPTTIKDNVFTIATPTLFVPGGTTATYSKTDGWSKFKTVFEGEKGEATVDDMTYVYATVSKTAILVNTATTESDVIIPATFKDGGVTYSVTIIDRSVFKGNSMVSLTIKEGVKTIREGAFQNCYKLQKMELPSSLTQIGESAFSSCNNILNIVSRIKVPFEFNENVFTSYTATLYVPEKTTGKYQETRGWKNFTSFLEGEMVTFEKEGMTYVYATGSKTAILVKSTSSDKDITIPATIEVDSVTYKVTTIDKSVFWGKNSLTNLTISEGVQIIGEKAFQNCSNLEKVELPTTITEIGDNAFNKCTRLAHVINKRKEPLVMNENVFSESSSTTATLYVPTGCSSLYRSAGGWMSFKTILEGELKIETIDNMTYYYVVGPNTATLAKAATTISDVTVPDTISVGGVTYKVTTIDRYAFSGINSLVNLTISEGIKTIGTNAFQNCNNLQRVTLPSSLTEIGDYAFDKCSRLTYVTCKVTKPFAISDNVFTTYTAKLNVPSGAGANYQKTDGWKNFSIVLEGDLIDVVIDGMTYTYATGPRVASLVKGATNVKDVTVPPTITVDNIIYTVTGIDLSAFSNVSYMENLTISEGIKTIGANAFDNCIYLNKVILPSTLISIGESAFNKCDRLSHVESFIKAPFIIKDNVFTTTTFSNATLYVPVTSSSIYKETAGWKNFTSILEGEIQEITVDGMTYICVPNLKIAKLVKGPAKTKEVTVPSTIQADGIKYDVTDIDRYAFHDFTSLVSLTISEGIKNIGMNAFTKCSYLTKVILPASLTSIGDKAFDGCNHLEDIYANIQKPFAISDNVFSNYSASLHVPEGTDSLYMNTAGWSNFTVVKLTSPVTIGGNGKTTYCGDKDLNFSFSDEVKAFIATGYDKDEGIIWMTRVKDVPAGVPVMIKGEANKTYDIPISSGGVSYYKNMFKGNTSGETISISKTSEDGKYENYYMSKGQFVKVNGSANIGNNKCYLQLPTTFEAASEGESQSVKIAASGKSSFAAPCDLDFTDLGDDLKAFTVTGYDKSTKTIWLTRVKKVQKGEGLLLKGTGGKTYEIPSSGLQDSYMNMFVGNISGNTLEIGEKSADGTLTNYYLKGGTYVSVSGTANIGNNKSYLQLPTSMLAGARGEDAMDADIESAYSFDELETEAMPLILGSIGDDDENTTGIESMFDDQSSMPNDQWYSLNGQRISKPTKKGLYIKNGRKVVVK